MSKLQVDTIVDKEDISAPTFSKGAIVTGVTTSTSFSGDVTGNVTGNQSGGSVSATTGSFSGNITGSTNASITKQITSEHVNISGVCTATSFSGDGSSLTGVANTGFINATQLSITGITTTTQVLPAADATHDLGSSSARWANLYVADMNFSNEGLGNDIDGTWGAYTIQEGRDDLFLINKRSGKKYKFNLTEVS